MQKRRAILESGKYHVWNITWDDLNPENGDHVMVCHAPVAQMLQQYANAAKSQGKNVPDARKVICNGMVQLKAFVSAPHAPGWAQLATFATYFPLQMLAAQRTVNANELRAALGAWRPGNALPKVAHRDNGDWVYNDRASLNQDLISYITVGDAVSNRQSQGITLARLGDSESETTGSDFAERWRRFLACLNLYQFSENFRFWAASESNTTAPEIPLQAMEAISDDWQPVLEEVLPSLKPYVQELASAVLPLPAALPKVEYFNDQIDDDAFAELAWPGCSPPIAVLAGDQTDFAPAWQQQGWKVVTPDDLQAKGIAHLIDLIATGISGA
jgi:DEAD/DEAH box helicase domain-containing protein